MGYGNGSLYTYIARTYLNCTLYAFTWKKVSIIIWLFAIKNEYNVILENSSIIIFCTESSVVLVMLLYVFGILNKDLVYGYLLVIWLLYVVCNMMVNWLYPVLMIIWLKFGIQIDQNVYILYKGIQIVSIPYR